VAPGFGNLVGPLAGELMIYVLRIFKTAKNKRQLSRPWELMRLKPELLPPTVTAVAGTHLALSVERRNVHVMNGFSWAFAAILMLTPLVESLAAEIDSGKQMYLKYCASCHGSTGKGDGPVSRDLKVKVPDLTLLKAKNKGLYPTNRVMSSIDGSRFVRGHGDRNMPVWGEVFREEHEKEKYTELTVLLKAKLIAEYVSTLQK
jgi:mono/diheme cytochrome c family protein